MHNSNNDKTEDNLEIILQDSWNYMQIIILLRILIHYTVIYYINPRIMVGICMRNRLDFILIVLKANLDLEILLLFHFYVL